MLIEAILLAASPATIVADDLSQVAPENTVAWVQTTDHAPFLELGLEHPIVAEILAHPVVKQDLERKGQDPVAALTGLEAILGEPPHQLASALASGGFGAGFLRSEDVAPHAFFVMRGADADDMEDALDTLIGAAATFGGVKALRASEREKLGGDVLDAWTVGKDGAVAAFTEHGLLFFATTFADLRDCTRGAGRATGLREARVAMDASTGTFAWLDLAALEADGKLEDLRKAATQPGMHFVMGPVLTYACTASSLGMTFHVDGESIEVRSRAIGCVAGTGAETFPAKDGVMPPLPAPSDDEVARAVLYRDVPTLLAQRTELFPPRAQPGIAEGLANLALLVGGSDAVDELFASVAPQMLLLAETVEYAAGSVPDVQLPAACLVARLEKPEINGPRIVGAFQSLIALTNVQRAQNGQPGLVLGLAPIEGVTMTLAKFPPPADGDGVDLAYNLAPGCAVIGDTVVLGTHHGLVSRVVGRIARGEVEPGSTRRIDDVRMRASALAQLIRANRDLLVMQQVLNEGKTQSRAEMEIDLLAVIFDTVDAVEFSTTGTADAKGALEATLRIGFAR